MRTIIAIAVLCCGVSTAFAQTNTPAGSFGIGGHIGDNSGLTLKAYQRAGFAYDLLASWDFDDHLFVNVHGLYERAIDGSPLNFYLGPGGFIDVHDRRENKVRVGVSGNFGLNFFADRFEVYLQLTPRLSLVPDTDSDIGGGVGLRYYF